MNNTVGIVMAGSALIPALVSGTTADDTVNTELRTILVSEDWAALKDIWHSIDKLKPSEPFSNFPISVEKGDSLSSVVRNLFTEGEVEDPQIEAAVSLIRRITLLRIMRLSRMNPSLITRMMPPWTDTVQDQLLFNFENKLATLNNLVDDGELTPVEFIAAREVLIEKAEILAVLQLVEESEIRPDYRYSVEYSDRLTTDLLLQQINLSYSAALDTLAKYNPGEYTGYYQQAADQYEAFQDDLEEFQRAEPILRIMLTDLMEAGV